MKNYFTDPKIKSYPIINPDGTNGKNWYVWFRINKGNPHRYSDGINEYNTYESRFENALVLREALKRKLESNWNPEVKDNFEITIQKLKLSDALDFALDKIKLRVADKTYLGYSGTANFVKKAITKLKYQNLYIDKLERIHVKLLFSEIQQSRKWSNTAYNKNINYFKAILSELLEYDLIKTNPAHGIKSLQEIKTEIHEPLTEAEQTKVISYLNEKLPNFLIFSKMLYHTGIRPVELLRLKCDMVDLEKETINLPANITKNKKSRQVPIVSDLLMDLTKFDLSNSDYYLFGTHRKQGGKLYYDKIFCPNLYSMKRDTPTKKWHQLVKTDLNIKKSLYSLKHKGANDKLVNGISLDAVKDIFGHSNTKITEIYGNIIKVMRFEEAKKNAGKFK